MPIGGPLGLQYLLDDVKGRRALALALRAREQQGGGEMVSGRYVPNLSGVAGALGRGIYGDPLDQLRKEEESAIAGYGNELAGATEALMGGDMNRPTAEFAKDYARGVTAGVPPEVLQRAMRRHQPLQMLDALLKNLDQRLPMPQQGVAPGGPGTGGGGGAANGLPPGPPGGGAPMPQGVPGSSGGPQGAPPGPQATQAPPNAMARAMAPRGGLTPLAPLPDGKLITIAALLEKDDPAAPLVKAEIESRQITQGRDGMLFRNGQPIGQLKDGVWYGADGTVEDIGGQAAAGRERTSADIKASRTPITYQQGDQTRTGFATDLPGYGGQAAPAPAPSGAPGPRGVNVRIDNGTPADVSALARDLSGESVGHQRAPQAGGGGYAPGVSIGSGDVKRRDAAIEAEGAGRKKLYEDQATQLSEGVKLARNAAEVGIPTIQTVRGILDSGKVKTGFGANWGLEFGRVLSASGLSNGEGVAATQSFVIASAKRVMALLSTGALGRTQISDADRRFMESAAAANISLDEKTIRRILDIDEKAQRDVIANHARNVQKSRSMFQSPDQEEFYRVDMPPGGSAAPPSADDLVRYYNNPRSRN